MGWWILALWLLGALGALFVMAELGSLSRRLTRIERRILADLARSRKGSTE